MDEKVIAANLGCGKRLYSNNNRVCGDEPGFWCLDCISKNVPANAAMLSEMISAVKAHALKHYETNGWDFVIECWTDDDIAKIVRPYTTTGAAILAVLSVVRQLDSRRRDISNA